MKQIIEGQFVTDGYRGLTEEATRQSLGGMIEAAFPKGTIVQVHLTVNAVGRRPLCQAETKYSTCNTVLFADGTCDNQAAHVVPEKDLIEVELAKALTE